MPRKTGNPSPDAPPAPTPPRKRTLRRVPTDEEQAAAAELLKMRPELKGATFTELMARPKEEFAAIESQLPGRIASTLSVNELNTDWYRLAEEYGVPVAYIKELAILFLDGRTRKTVYLLVKKRLRLVQEIPGYDCRNELILSIHINMLIRIIFDTIKAQPQLWWKTYHKPMDKRRKADYDY